MPQETEGSIVNDYQQNNVTYLCMNVVGNKFGFSIIQVCSNNVVALKQDINFNAAFLKENVINYLNNLILNYRPSILLLSTKIRQDIYDEIERLLQQQKGKLNELKVRFLSWSKFDKKFLEQELKDSNNSFACMDENKNCKLLNKMMLVFNSGWDITCGTLSCVLQTIINDEKLVDQGQQKLEINNLTFNLMQFSDSFVLDDDTINSLQVLPSLYKTKVYNSNKRGCLSLYELFEKSVKSELGKQVLKSWLTTPLKTKDLIVKRLQIVKILVATENTSVLDQLSWSLKKIPDIYRLLSSVSSRICNKPHVWIALVKFCETMIEIKKIINLLDSAYRQGVLKDLHLAIEEHKFKKIMSKINKVFNLENSLKEKELIINTGVNKELDKHINFYNNLEVFLEDIAVHIRTGIINDINCAAKLDPTVQNNIKNLINVAYIPQIGYLISIDIEAKELLEIVQDWVFIFETPTALYYKNNDIMKVDKEYGDICGIISDYQIEIFHDVQTEIIQYKLFLRKCYELSAELEVLKSFAETSIENNFKEPELSSKENKLIIVQGRHPIFENLVDSYIPNDISLIGSRFDDESWNTMFCRIALITGANMSGKTVFITSCGIIVLLSHIGCFVPAISAKIGIVDNILTRIKTSEGINHTQSTFYSDCQQMSKCLALSTERSLVLIDEFGKGTSPIDGPALFAAIIRQMSEYKHCPRMLVCTHYHELYKKKIFSPQLKGTIHLTTTIFVKKHKDGNEDNSTEVITFLYKVKEGISNDSFGLFCASLSGIQPAILNRAHAIVDAMNQGRNISEISNTVPLQELTLFKKNQKIVEEFLSWDIQLEDDNDIAIKEKLKFFLQKDIS
ncbi:MutS family protein MSH5 SCDLUD_000251 [Saccharomycodes ludwigii]|uniref:MutS family protein MSH5 n=1 Tax=Saccharomycodes ludwigii TaxID=36035 RepID=UPI001E8A453C|nr:hypothetical protein SCDLUD_000251 [Saccharomycodes ludwigii]KAH3902668.1 hypothetical protein SCDLUD_000251 [Saccharomycodes ludwigii]